MSQPPKISIITICLNNLDGLKKTHSSIQKQTQAPFEWIVIDGGSKDGTEKFLKSIKPKFWVSEADHGIYDAMNKGIQKAKGDYILFLNAGDRLFNSKILSIISTLIDKNLPDFIYGDSHEGKHYKKARNHKNIAWGMFTHHQSMIYKRSILDGLYFHTNYEIAADYDFTIRFLKRS